MSFDINKWLDFHYLTNIPLIPKTQQLFLTKGWCYPLVEDDERIRFVRESYVWTVSERESSSNVMTQSP